MRPNHGKWRNYSIDKVANVKDPETQTASKATCLHLSAEARIEHEGVEGCARMQFCHGS